MKNSNQFPGIFPNDLSEDYLSSLKNANEKEARLDRFYAWFIFIALDAIIIGILLAVYYNEGLHSMIPILKGGIATFAGGMIPIKIKKEKKEKKTDDANLSKIKDASKEKKDITRSSLYRGVDQLSMRDQKKERSKIRRKLDAFCNAILGKDRSKEEKDASIKEFNAFYKKNWKLNDYKIDNFSNRSDEDQRKDYQSILDLAKKSLG